jgi:hypothetical protein
MQVVMQRLNPEEDHKFDLSQSSLRRRLNGRNSPRRTPEIAGTVGSRKVAGELSIG